jgi:hypothetical protein
MTANVGQASSLSPGPPVDDVTEKLKAEMRNKCTKLDQIIAQLKPLAADDPDLTHVLLARMKERDETIKLLREMKPLAVQLQQAAAARDKAKKLAEASRLELAELARLVDLKQQECQALELGAAAATSEYARLVQLQLVAGSPGGSLALGSAVAAPGSPTHVLQQAALFASFLTPELQASFSQWVQGCPAVPQPPTASLPTTLPWKVDLAAGDQEEDAAMIKDREDQEADEELRRALATAKVLSFIAAGGQLQQIDLTTQKASGLGHFGKAVKAKPLRDSPLVGTKTEDAEEEEDFIPPAQLYPVHG